MINLYLSFLALNVSLFGAAGVALAFAEIAALAGFISFLVENRAK